MAVVLHASGYDIGLCPAHLKVADRLLDDPSLLRPGSAERLQAVLSACTHLSENSGPCGVMIAAGGDGQSGLARTLIERWVGPGKFPGMVAALGLPGRPTQYISRGADSFNVDQPIVIAEFPLQSTPHSVQYSLDTFYANGYADESAVIMIPGQGFPSLLWEGRLLSQW